MPVVFLTLVRCLELGRLESQLVPQMTFHFPNCSIGTQIMLIIFLNNYKGYSIIMNHFLPVTLYSEAAEDLIE